MNLQGAWLAAMCRRIRSDRYVFTMGDVEEVGKQLFYEGARAALKKMAQIAYEGEAALLPDHVIHAQATALGQEIEAFLRGDQDGQRAPLDEAGTGSLGADQE